MTVEQSGFDYLVSKMSQKLKIIMEPISGFFFHHSLMSREVSDVCHIFQDSYCTHSEKKKRHRGGESGFEIHGLPPNFSRDVIKSKNIFMWIPSRKGQN